MDSNYLHMPIWVNIYMICSQICFYYLYFVCSCGTLIVVDKGVLVYTVYSILQYEAKDNVCTHTNIATKTNYTTSQLLI
jgi:hypothetical protein